MLKEPVLQDNVLLCPQCNDEHLHHGEVRVLTRPNSSEDNTAIQFSLHKAPKIIPQQDAPGRRNSLEIDFYCESCSCENADQPYTLRIVQHKGSTLINWLDLAKATE